MRPQDISILVVDDEADVREVLQETFESHGFNVKGAADGAEAWEALSRDKFHLVVTDLRMPRMSGQELIKKIRLSNVDSPKILAISGYTENSVEELLNMGCDGFFAKPFNAETVRSAIKRCLLSNSEQWGTPPGQSCKFSYSKKFSTGTQMIASGEVGFGRSGIFLSLSEKIAPVGELVEFSIQLSDSRTWKELSGVGRVVWARNAKKDEKATGLGVEFLYLKPECMHAFLPWLSSQKFVASVPS